MSSVEAGEGTDFDSMWPREGEKPFVEVPPWQGAWAAKRTDERLYRMIKGFHEAGDLLVAESTVNPRRSLNLLFPAIFSYRQSLELRLKYLLMAYGPHAGEAADFRSHGLSALWSKCRRVILHFEGEAMPTDHDTFNAVDAQIAEFDAVDPGSDTFRFAHNTKGEAITLSVTEINLPSLQRVVASLHNFLECADCQLRYGHGILPCEH
jgi:hypothetical protein